jgi:DNA-binding PadR family transcriptional regulator
LASEHLILGVLLRAPGHGYEIRRRLAALPGLQRPMESSQVYALLHRLEDRGLLAAREEPRAPGQVRRIYRLSARGRRAIESWLARPVRAGAAARRPLVLRLAAGCAPRPSARALGEALRTLRRRVARGAAAESQASGVARALLARQTRRLEVECAALERWISAAAGLELTPPHLGRAPR